MTDTPSKWRATIAVHPAADMFPMMSDAELDVLAADIKKNGLAHKVTLWGPRCSEIENIKDFQLLDGRNRLEAMERAGIQVDLDRHFEFYFTDMKIDPYEYVVSANIHRRHLTAEQKRDLIAKLLAADPGKSDRAVAKIAKVDNKTVASVRREVEAREEIPHVDTRTDTKGRQQPARKPATAAKIRAQRKAKREAVRARLEAAIQQRKIELAANKAAAMEFAVELRDRFGAENFGWIAAQLKLIDPHDLVDAISDLAATRAIQLKATEATTDVPAAIATGAPAAIASGFLEE
jgi:hypothetical protein